MFKILKYPNVVEIQLANIHPYPVWVSLPKGVELERDAQSIEYDHVEELMTQFVALSIHDGGYILREDHINLLKVHLSELTTGSRIIMHVEPASLIADMGVWLVDMVAGGKVTLWAAQFKKLKNVVEIKDAFDNLTSCISKHVSTFKEKYHDPNTFHDKAVLKNLIVDSLSLIVTCDASSAKAIYAIWSKITGTVQTAEEDDKDPLTLMISRFRFLYENPGLVDEWVAGMIAWLTPDNAGRVSIDLIDNSLAGVDWNKIITSSELGCNSQTGLDLRTTADAMQFADMNDDGKAEVFVVATCIAITAPDWPSVLYVYDGASDPAHPQRIASLVDYYHNKPGSVINGILDPRIDIQVITSVTLAQKTATVESYGWSPSAYGCCPDLQITDIFTWNGNGFITNQHLIGLRQQPNS